MSLYDQLFAEPKVKVYRFIPICDSDFCRSAKRSGKHSTGKRSDVGMIKRGIKKGTMQCPECHMYLFWLKEEIL